MAVHSAVYTTRVESKDVPLVPKERSCVFY
jgi:hypothetical protein